jgi:hypothetical protein
MSNIHNLISLADRTEEDRKIIATLGGIASGEARRRKKLQTNDVETFLRIARMVAPFVLMDLLAERGFDRRGLRWRKDNPRGEIVTIDEIMRHINKE